MNALVGLTWLKAGDRAVSCRSRRITLPELTDSSQFPFYRPAVKQNNQWDFSASQHRCWGPYNPSGKSALVAVTRGGTLRLIFQGADNRWYDAAAEIESTLTSSDVLTHAAICGDKGEWAFRYS